MVGSSSTLCISTDLYSNILIFRNYEYINECNARWVILRTLNIWLGQLFKKNVRGNSSKCSSYFSNIIKKQPWVWWPVIPFLCSAYFPLNLNLTTKLLEYIFFIFFICSACSDSAGIEFAWIRDSLMTASSEQQYAPAYRARLNALTLPPIVQGLSDGYSGGWKPLLTDTQPWIQVSL